MWGVGFLDASALTPLLAMWAPPTEPVSTVTPADADILLVYDEDHTLTLEEQIYNNTVVPMNADLAPIADGKDLAAVAEVYEKNGWTTKPLVDTDTLLADVKTKFAENDGERIRLMIWV
jgi:hypothetical protein